MYIEVAVVQFAYAQANKKYCVNLGQGFVEPQSGETPIEPL